MKHKKDKCRSCKADIIWVTTEKGKLQPLDAEPEKRVVIRGSMAFSMPTYMPHHATCPQADQWRKKKDDRSRGETKAV